MNICKVTMFLLLLFCFTGCKDLPRLEAVEDNEGGCNIFVGSTSVFSVSVDSVDSVDSGDSVNSVGIVGAENLQPKELYSWVVISEDFSNNAQRLAALVAAYSYSPPLDPVYSVDQVSLGSVSINRASLFELCLVPGVGNHGAETIIANRPYSSLDALHVLSGLKKKNLELALPYFRL